MRGKRARAAAADVTSSEPAPAVTEDAGARPTLLIVEDDADLVAILAALLAADYQTVVAGDGVEALEVLRREEVHLVISDIMMPRMDGTELLARIRRDPRFDDLPVIILTAVPDPDLRVTLLQAGATDFLSKPFSAPELLARVRNVGDAALLRRQLQTSLTRRTAELTEANRQLVHLTEHDSLTGLPNRTHLIEYLDRLMREAGGPLDVGVLLIGIEGLDQITGVVGFDAGDAALIEIANRFSALTGPDEMLVRLEGSTFALAAAGRGGLGFLTRKAQRMLRALASPVTAGNDSVVLTASAGISGGSQAGPKHLLRQADLAMCRARLEGRNRVTVFDESLHQAAAARLETEQALRDALRNHQFRLYYQPEFTLADGGLGGFEALIRWHKQPDRPVPPGQFLPVAEAAGLMDEIDLWVLANACQDSVRWRDQLAATGGRVWINISAQTLQRPDLADLVSDAIRAAGTSPDLIGIEISETLAMDTGVATDQFQGIVDLGVPLAIDDFGTGYSSLARLRDLPIALLKIDISLIRGVAEDRRSASIVGAAIGMGHSMGMTVLAEGIETREQRDLLIELDCDLGQGFYLGRPEPVERISIQT